MNLNESNPPPAAGPGETGAVEVCPSPVASPQHARKGKIARLPLEIRTELNQRIRNGEAGTDLVSWLNGLAEVKEVLQARFAGAELSESNLSRWREGGYQEWLAEESTKEAAAALAQRAAALQGFTLDTLTHNLALVTVARLAEELRRIESMEDDEARFKCLRDIIWAVIFLRRGEAESERLKREEAKRAGFRLPPAELEKQFWLWASDPENKASVWKRLFMTEAEKKAAIDEILSDDGKFWAADEAYIEAHGGKLGAKLPEDLLQAIKEMKARQAE